MAGELQLYFNPIGDGLSIYGTEQIYELKFCIKDDMAKLKDQLGKSNGYFKATNAVGGHFRNKLHVGVNLDATKQLRAYYANLTDADKALIPTVTVDDLKEQLPDDFLAQAAQEAKNDANEYIVKQANEILKSHSNSLRELRTAFNKLACENSQNTLPVAKELQHMNNNLINGDIFDWEEFYPKGLGNIVGEAYNALKAIWVKAKELFQQAKTAANDYIADRANYILEHHSTSLNDLLSAFNKLAYENSPNATAVAQELRHLNNSLLTSNLSTWVTFYPEGLGEIVGEGYNALKAVWAKAKELKEAEEKEAEDRANAYIAKKANDILANHSGSLNQLMTALNDLATNHARETYPLTPSLQRMYSDLQTGKSLTWFHFYNDKDFSGIVGEARQTLEALWEKIRETANNEANTTTQERRNQQAEQQLKDYINKLKASQLYRGTYSTFLNFSKAYDDKQNSTDKLYGDELAKRQVTHDILIKAYETVRAQHVDQRDFKLQRMIAKSLVDTTILRIGPDWDPKQRHEKIEDTITALWDDEAKFNTDNSGFNEYNYKSLVKTLKMFNDQLKPKIEKHNKTNKPFDMYNFIIKLLKKNKYADINKLPKPSKVDLNEIDNLQKFNTFETKFKNPPGTTNFILTFVIQFAITMSAIQVYTNKKIEDTDLKRRVKDLKETAEKLEEYICDNVSSLNSYGPLPVACVIDALVTCHKVFGIKIPS